MLRGAVVIFTGILSSIYLFIIIPFISQYFFSINSYFLEEKAIHLPLARNGIYLFIISCNFTKKKQTSSYF